MGDGPEKRTPASQESRKVKQQAHRRAKKKKIIDELLSHRTGAFTSSDSYIAPAIGYDTLAGGTRSRPAPPPPLTEEMEMAQAYYSQNPGRDKRFGIYMGSERPNVTNDPQQEGLFAEAVLLPGDFLIYLGIYQAEGQRNGMVTGNKLLELAPLSARAQRSGVAPEALNAEGVIFDVGHILALPPHRRTNTKLTRAFGQAVNALSEKQINQGIKYNLKWRSGDSTRIRGWEVITQVAIGDELLGTYNAPEMVGDSGYVVIRKSAGVQHLPNLHFRFGRRWSCADYSSIPAKGYCALLLLHHIHCMHSPMGVTSSYSSALNRTPVRLNLANFAEHIIASLQAHNNGLPVVCRSTPLILQGYADTLRSDGGADPCLYSPTIVRGITDIAGYNSTDKSVTDLWIPADQLMPICAVMAWPVSLWVEDPSLSIFPEGWAQLQSSTIHVMAASPMAPILDRLQSSKVLELKYPIAYAANHFFHIKVNAALQQALLSNIQGNDTVSSPAPVLELPLPSSSQHTGSANFYEQEHCPKSLRPKRRLTASAGYPPRTHKVFQKRRRPVLHGDEYSSDDSGDGTMYGALAPTYRDTNINAIRLPTTTCITDIRMRPWAVISPSENYAAVLSQPFIGELMKTINGGINALPPVALLELFHSSDSVHIACRTSKTDAQATPGKGYCGPAAARIIQLHTNGVYPTPSLSDSYFTKPLLSIIGKISGNIRLFQSAPQTEEQDTRKKLLRTLTAVSTGLTKTQRGRKVHSVATSDYMPSEEFITMCSIWPGAPPRLMLWIAIPAGTARGMSKHTPFGPDWAMGSDSLDGGHNVLQMAGASSPSQLITASKLPHHIIMSGTHYCVHRGDPPDEDILTCIAALERMIIRMMIDKSVIQPTPSSLLSGARPAINIQGNPTVDLTEESSMAGYDEDSVTLVGLPVRNPTTLTTQTIHSVRSGPTTMGISDVSLRKMQAKWDVSISTPLVDWVQNYIQGTACLQLTTALERNDARIIPGKGYCAYLAIYWVYMRDVLKLRPRQITTRLNLTQKNNRALLADMLRILIRTLDEAEVVDRADDLRMTNKMTYTMTRLIGTDSDCMLDAVGIDNWLSNWQVHRLVALFSSVNLWTTSSSLGDTHRVALLATNKHRLASGRHCDTWKGPDIARLHTSDDAHIFYSEGGLHFSVVSAPPKKTDIVNCYVTLSNLIQRTLGSTDIIPWPSGDISNLTCPDSTTGTRSTRGTSQRHKAPSSFLPPAGKATSSPASDDESEDEDYCPTGSTKKIIPPAKSKKGSGAAHRHKANARRQTKSKDNAATTKKRVTMVLKSGGVRRKGGAASISVPVRAVPAVATALQQAVAQPFLMPARIRRPPERYTGIAPATELKHATDAYVPIVTPPIAPHYSTEWDDSTGDRMFIAPSRIEGAGQGAYAAHHIAANTTIGQYKGGENLKVRDVLRSTYKSDYVWTDEARGIVRDAKDPRSCATRFLNDAIDSQKDNCQFQIIDNQVYLVALRDIATNEELYASYGETYWRHSRWSSQILEMARIVHERPASAVIWKDLIKYKKWDEQFPNTPYVSASRSLPDRESIPLDAVHLQESVLSWDTKSKPINLKIGTWNVNGVTAKAGIGTSKIIDFYRHSGMDILFLTDTRLTAHQAGRLAKRVKTALPGHAVVQFPSTHFPGRIAGGSTLSMGGMMAIVSSQWEPYISNTQVDSSGLGLVGKVTLSYNKGANKIDVIGAYLPPRPGTNPGPLTIWSRLTAFLAKSSQRMTPRAYTEHVVERWMVKAAEANRQVFLCGDLNGVLETKCSQRDIRPWINSLNLVSPHMIFLRPQVEYHTFFRKDRGISRIDHVLHTPLPADQSVVEVGMDNDVAFVHYFDHRPIWIGIHIAHVHTATTRPPPKLERPLPVEIPKYACVKREEYILTLDAARTKELGNTADVIYMTPEQQSCTLAALLRITIASASTACGITSKNRIHRLCRKKRSSYKDGYSPSMRILQESMHFFIRIRRLVNSRRRNSTWTKANYYAILLKHIGPWKRRVQKFLDPGQDINRAGLKLCNPLFLLPATFMQISNKAISEKIKTLRSMLQGRFRSGLRATVSAAVQRLEDLRIENKIGLMIKRLGDKEQFSLELFSMNDPIAGRITNPVTIHENLTDANRDLYSVPTNLDPAAAKLQDKKGFWCELLHGVDDTGVFDDESDIIHEQSSIPPTLQRKIKDVCKIKASDHLIRDMKTAMEADITFEDFEEAIKALKYDKAPGPSMVTPNMIKAWSTDTLRFAYALIHGLWQAKHIPKWWSDHILCPAPKKSNDPVMDNIRPIGLFEVIRKAWTGIIGARIHTMWDQHNILHHAQHGFRWRQGTDTAIIKLINALEGTREGETPRFCTLWDVRKAFDSVPRNLLRLAWSRLGVPGQVVQWLTGLDEDGLTFVKSPHMSERLEPRSLQDIKNSDGHFIARDDLGFKAVRGIGQGDNLSTLSWIALFDILLCLCEDESIAYADDLINACHSKTDIQIKADKVSAFCAFTGLEIAASKILAVLITVDVDGDSDPDPAPLIVRDWHWRPTSIPFETARTSMKYLGVDISTTALDSDSYTWCHNAITRQLRHLTARRATSACKMKLIQSQVLPTILYRASKACWTLSKYQALDKLFAAAYRLILRLNIGFPAELLYAPYEFAGLNLPRFSDLAQLQKWGSIHRALNLGGEPAQAATDLLTRVQQSDTPDTCYFGTSLAEWGKKAGLALHCTAPIIPEHRRHQHIDIGSLQQRLGLDVGHAGDTDWSDGASVFSDGSYTTSQLTPYSILDDQWNVRRQGTGGAGMIWLGPRDRWRTQRPRILRILSDAAPTMGLNSYAFELLGITVASQMSEHIPRHVDMISDCKGAVTRIEESMHIHHRALGHLAKGIFCESVMRTHDDDLEARRVRWTRSHPERQYPDNSFWSYEDWGIWLADAIAEGDRQKLDDIFGVNEYDWEEVQVSQIIDTIVQDGLWHWRTNDETATVITDDIMHHIHPTRIHEYLRTRDLYRFKRGIVDQYWGGTAPQLPAQCATKPKNIYDAITISKRVWDKWTTGRLLAKGKVGAEAATLRACPLCGDPDSQAHIFTECQHPNMLTLRAKAFDLQAQCLLKLEAEAAFADIPWLRTRMTHMTRRANSSATRDVERLWLGTFTTDTIDVVIGLENRYNEFSPAQYASYCKIITDLTRVRSNVAEEMISARYHLYHEEKRRLKNINKRLPSRQNRHKQTSLRKNQRRKDRLDSSQQHIDNMFPPDPPTQRVLRRRTRYRALQDTMRTRRAAKAALKAQKDAMQTRILLVPQIHYPTPPANDTVIAPMTQRRPVGSLALCDPSSDSRRDYIEEDNISDDDNPTPSPPISMILGTFNDMVSQHDIDLDSRMHSAHTYPVDRSLGTDTHDVNNLARQRDG